MVCPVSVKTGFAMMIDMIIVVDDTVSFQHAVPP